MAGSRKPRSIELAAETLTTDDDHAQEVTAPATEIQAAKENAKPDVVAVAATAGPNQAMAKLLLAARAEGANSRWPF